MLWPVTDANFDTASYNQFENGYFLSKNMMKWFWDNYTTSAADRNNILASPLRASTAQLKGFPETLIQQSWTFCGMKVKHSGVNWMRLASR
jgi:acetyl esterase/lipase